MAPRSLWNVILKILGISFAYKSITAIWTSINLVIVYSSLSTTMFKYFNVNYLYFSIIAALLIFIVNILVVYFCLFKTDSVINKLKLDKGFSEERFDLNIHRHAILRIIFMITGGLLVINMFPDLVDEIAYYFEKVHKHTPFENNRDLRDVVVDAIRIIIGLCIIGFNESIVKFIEKKSNKSDAGHIEESSS